MAVGKSICAAQLYDKVANIGKITKYKLSKYVLASILQNTPSYPLTWVQEKSAKNIFIR